jgi:hypothetical protein
MTIEERLDKCLKALLITFGVGILSAIIASLLFGKDEPDIKKDTPVCVCCCVEEK